ncbi:hypothetical protein Plhal304r1_c004g0017131 [Plasmopara halstedii]
MRFLSYVISEIGIVWTGSKHRNGSQHYRSRCAINSSRMVKTKLRYRVLPIELSRKSRIIRRLADSMKILVNARILLWLLRK